MGGCVGGWAGGWRSEGAVGWGGWEIPSGIHECCAAKEFTRWAWRKRGGRVGPFPGFCCSNRPALCPPATPARAQPAYTLAEACSCQARGAGTLSARHLLPRSLPPAPAPCRPATFSSSCSRSALSAAPLPTHLRSTGAGVSAGVSGYLSMQVSMRGICLCIGYLAARLRAAL